MLASIIVVSVIAGGLYLLVRADRNRVAGYRNSQRKKAKSDDHEEESC